MPSPKHSRLIAVIEDDRAVLDALEFTLETQGYAVCPFERGRDALRSRKITGADCLVIDYAMPEMDGITLLRALRRRGLKCPAIIIASNPTLECRRGALAANAPLIEKPLMDDVLGRRIRDEISRK